MHCAANATGGELTLEHESAAISIHSQHDDLLMAGEKSTVCWYHDCGRGNLLTARRKWIRISSNRISRKKRKQSSVCEFVASVVNTDHEKLEELEDENSIDHSGVHLMAKDIEADYVVPENSSAVDSLGPASTPQETLHEQTGRGNTQHDDSMVGEQSIVSATIADSETIDCDKKIYRNIVKQNAMKEEKPSICDFMAQVAKTDHETQGRQS